MSYLFPNFLKDPNEFENAKNYWHSLCQDVLNKNNQLIDWAVWFEDNSQILESSDNFPIYSLINREKTKGVIINQQDPQVHTKWETVAYTKEYDRKDSDFWGSQYLVFNCNLSEKSAELFKKLFDVWIQPKTNKEELEKLIDTLDVQ